MEHIFIIAEAGVNHNGSAELAREMIDCASAAGADAVKFQTFKAANVISRFAPKANYQLKSTNKNESQLEMIRKLELAEDVHRELVDYCAQKKIVFLSTPFDFESIDLLNVLGLPIFKVPSGEITNLPYLRKIGGLKKKVILSTGMADLEEIKNALQVLNATGTLMENIIVLHCNSEYPTPMPDVNLKAMLTIRDVFGVKVGYSDHTLGIEIPIAAAALGAAVIEKHFTLNRNLEGPDHSASLEPAELAAMVHSIRNIENAMGDGVKRPTPSEIENREVIRKSIVAACEIKKGEIFSERNLAVKRPGSGINPMEWDQVMGRISQCDFKPDEFIKI